MADQNRVAAAKKELERRNFARQEWQNKQAVKRALPGKKRVDEEIAQRKPLATINPAEESVLNDLLTDTGQRGLSLFPGSGDKLPIIGNPNKPFDTAQFRALQTGMAAVGMPLERLMSGFNNTIRKLQEGEFEASTLLEEARKGIAGEKVSRGGDVFSGMFADEDKIGRGFSEALGFLTDTGMTMAAGKIGAFAKARIPKLPKLHTDKWVDERVRQGADIAKTLDNVLGKSFKEARGAVRKVPIDSSAVDDILLKVHKGDGSAGFTVPNAVVKEIDREIGKVNNVDKLYKAAQIVRKRITASVKKGKTSGIGGQFNDSNKANSVARQMKELVHQQVESMEGKTTLEGKFIRKGYAKELRALDDFAHKEVYPTIDTLKGMTDVAKQDVKTSGSLISTFKGGKSSGPKREFVRSIPKVTKKLKKYVADDQRNDVIRLTENSHKFIKDLQRFRQREIIKSVIKNPVVQLGTGFGLGALGLRDFQR